MCLLRVAWARWGGDPCPAHPPLFPADGRFRGAPPGHTGETLGPLSLILAQVGGASPPPNPRQPIKACDCPSVLQPGKLTEAFKYFLQGMGYSKLTSPCPCPGDWWAGGRVGLAPAAAGDTKQPGSMRSVSAGPRRCATHHMLPTMTGDSLGHLHLSCE